MRLCPRLLSASFVIWFALCVGCVARTEAQDRPLPVSADELQTLTFSNLIVRVTGESWIGVADAELRVKILEHLRKRGYPALGAESLVFNRDKGEQAKFLLGGTLTRVDCNPKGSPKDRLCRVEIKWELFDEAEERVVYTMVARSSVAHLNLTHAGAKQSAGEQLILSALDSLLKRPRFVESLKKGPAQTQVASEYRPATFRTCSSGLRPMPASANSVLSATVLVQTPRGFGSGSMISPDGLVLTAAHVVRDAGSVEIKLISGQVLPAKVVRLHKGEDVALLYASVPSDADCIPLRAEAPQVGEEIYAIGSPASKELAFTLTRGIVSGTREIEGVRYLQTDASVNPGNSGGPLIDGQGQVLGVVSWKIVGSDTEGLAFGVPVLAAQSALAVTPGSSTDASLRSSAPTSQAARAAFEDKPDAMPVVDPEGDRVRAQRLQASKARKRSSELRALRRKATPPYVKLLKFGGAALLSAGALGVMSSWLSARDDSITYDEYTQQRLINDLSWGGVIVGAGCVTAGLFLTPKVTLPDERPKSKRVQVAAGLGLGSASLTVTY